MRYARWCKLGILDMLQSALSRDADILHVCIDSSIIRVNANAARAANCTEPNEVLGARKEALGARYMR